MAVLCRRCSDGFDGSMSSVESLKASLKLPIPLVPDMRVGCFSLTSSFALSMIWACPVDFK